MTDEKKTKNQTNPDYTPNPGEKTFIDDSSNAKTELTDATMKPTLTANQTQNYSPTNEFNDIPKPKKPTGLYILIIILFLALLVMAYFTFLKPKTPTLATEASTQIRQQQELAQQVDSMESQVKQKQDQMFTLIDDYKNKSGEQAVVVNPLNLTPQEKELLEKKISEEKDVSIKSLLEEILEKDNEIKDLKSQIKEIEALLPVPHIVKEGESHYKIAMDFLLNEKKVEKDRAMKLIDRAALYDSLIPGFKVWNFYTGEEYGTSVSQGSASVSPNTITRTIKKKLVDARDQAISERDTLALDIKELEKKKDAIIQQLEMLSKEKEQLIDKVSELNQQVNSLFFLVDSQSNLKKKGILEKRFLGSTKLRDVSPGYFSKSIDLRTDTVIPFSASDLGLSKIKEVILYPKFYKEGTDFKIEITDDKLSASITILDVAKFKNERIVVSVK